MKGRRKYTNSKIIIFYISLDIDHRSKVEENESNMWHEKRFFFDRYQFHSYRLWFIFIHFSILFHIKRYCIVANGTLIIKLHSFPQFNKPTKGFLFIFKS